MLLASCSPCPIGRALSREAVAVILAIALAFQARLWCFHGETGLCVPGISRHILKTDVHVMTSHGLWERDQAGFVCS